MNKQHNFELSLFDTDTKSLHAQEINPKQRKSAFIAVLLLKVTVNIKLYETIYSFI